MTQTLSAFTLIAGALFILSRCDVVVAQLNEVPPCLTSVAAACAQNALKSVEPSACNWQLIMPVMTQCVTEAASGCTTRQILDWIRIVAQFNETLNSANCSKTCPNPDTSRTAMDQCYVFDRTVNSKQYTSIDVVADDIIKSPTSSSALCTLLNEVIRCLTNATAGCAGLMSVTEQRLQNANVNNASVLCNVAMFVGPTTSAPLAIYSAITNPPSTTTTQAAAQRIIIADGQEGHTAIWVTIIVLGGVVCVAMVIAAGVLLHRAVGYRGQAKHMDDLHRNRELAERNRDKVKDVLSRHTASLTGAPRTRTYRLP